METVMKGRERRGREEGRKGGRQEGRKGDVVRVW